MKNRFFQVFRRIPELELNSSPTVTFVSQVDLTKIEKIRKLMGQNKPSYTAFVIKALAITLRSCPYANQRISRRAWLPFARPRLQKFDRFDIAVAAEREMEGVESAAFVDIFQEADQKPLQKITQLLSDLSKADLDTNRQWAQFYAIIRWCPTWLALFFIELPFGFPQLWTKYRGSAALVTSPAKYGVDTVVACWSWPIGVSFGLVKDRPVVKDGQLKICPTFNLTLNFDRRIMAGAQAGRFFAKFVERLENADGLE